MAEALSPSQHIPLRENAMANNLDLDALSASPAASESKKRKCEAGSEVENETKKGPKKRDTGSGRICHQCHQKKEQFLHCTVMKPKGKKTERCSSVFCMVCLKRRYDIDMAAIVAAGRPNDFTKLLGHVHTEQYVWKCPVCTKSCNCHVHRKEYGQPLLGNVSKLAKERGISVPELIRDSVALEAARQAEKDRRSSVASQKQAKQEARQATADLAKKSVPKLKHPEESKATGGNAIQKGNGADVKPNGITVPAIDTTMSSKLPPRPKPFIKSPKPVADPNFEFVAISHPLSVIRKRLRIREFVLRFEKQLNRVQLAPLPGKYIRIINDPNADWTDLTYRNLICNFLSVVQPDDWPLRASDVKESIIQIQRTHPDSPNIWVMTKSLLEGILEVDDLENFEDEDTRLELVMPLVDLAVGSSFCRQQIDKDMEKQKESHKRSYDKIKQLKADWEEQKTALHKERLQLKQGERSAFDEKYNKAFTLNKRLIALEEQQEWFASRKLACRTTPIGVDSKGNVYWHFIQRQRDVEDWGQWVVVERAENIPHPSGVLPKFDPSSVVNEGEEDHIGLPEQDDEETVRSRIWYAVSGAANIRHLADWVAYTADLVWYMQAMAREKTTMLNGRQTASGLLYLSSFSQASGKNSSGPPTPNRQILQEVRLPIRSPGPTSAPSAKLSPEELMTKESISSLVQHLKKIASFQALEEEGAHKLV